MASPAAGPVPPSHPPMVSPRLFKAIQTVRVDVLAQCGDAELRPALASLVRMSLIASLDTSTRCMAGRNAVLQVLSRIELVNNLVALLSIDFHALETDVRKEQQLRAKMGGPVSAGESVLISNLTLGPALEFERSDATRRLRLVLSELLAIMGQIRLQMDRAEESAGSAALQPPAASSCRIIVKPSELFDHIVYLSEVCDVLSIAMAELPLLLSPPEVAEALLRLKYGPTIICHVVANQPDSFHDVVLHLLKNGDKQDDEGSNKIRQAAILQLCEMNPSEIITVRNRCIEWCKMPSLALYLTLEGQKRDKNCDLISFLSGLLLGSDPQIRSWISFFVRSGQKKRNSDEALTAYREALLGRLGELVTIMSSEDPRDEAVVRSCALLRLYTALRGIAGMKLSDQEVALLSELITSRPPPTPAGVQFVSLGLSMLIACNSLISTPPLERKAVEWIKWLVREEEYFERKSGVSASFGEMLLLMAIHFHSQNLSAIIELVCQTLGMKIVIRTANMNRMKTIFTQEIFHEQVWLTEALFTLQFNNRTVSGGRFACCQSTGHKKPLVRDIRLPPRPLHPPTAQESDVLEAQGSHQGLGVQSDLRLQHTAPPRPPSAHRGLRELSPRACVESKHRRPDQRADFGGRGEGGVCETYFRDALVRAWRRHAQSGRQGHGV